MPSSIKWDDKFFERSGLFIWIYRDGYLESSNERFYRSNLVKSFRQKQEQGLNNIKLIRLNERKKQ